MSYLKTSFGRSIYLLYILVVLACTSCSKDENITPTALNSFKGEIAGTNFEANYVSGTQDSSLYSIEGTIKDEAVFKLYIRDNNLVDHNISTALDEIIDTIKVLNELISTDTSLLDSLTTIIDSLTSDNTLNSIIPDNTSYMFYYVGGFLYFSTMGNVTLSSFDESLNRGSGNFDLELKSLYGGVKQLVGTFEDVEFIKEE